MPRTAADVKYDLDNLRHDLCLEETEDSWEKIAKALLSFAKVGERGGYDDSPSEIVNALRSSQRPITNAMNSERTRLCGPALDLIASVAGGIGHDFDQLMPIFMPPLLTLCGRPNKVVLNRARTAINAIIESTQLASALTFFVVSVKDKSATLRLVVAEATLACLNSCNPPDLEKEVRARDIETIIRGTARDANPDVRKVSRKIFESYKILLPSRVESFTAPLTPTMKKYLEIKTNNLTTSKSTSNLRANLNLKPEAKPSTSSAVSTSAIGRPAGHARTASSSTATGATAAQSRNLATTLTRVSRKEPTKELYVPVRPVQASRTVSEPAKVEGQRPATATTSASRTTTAPENKQVAPPLRSKPSIISRATAPTMTTASSSSAPRRLQLAEMKPPATSQTSTTTGPRRVPMPPPPPPAPKKEHSRPASRIDSATSTSRTAAPSAQAKKPASATPVSRVDNATSSSSRMAVPAAPIKKSVPVPAAGTRGRAPSTKPPIPKFKPTPNSAAGNSAAGSSTGAVNTKPLTFAKAKPTWGGRPAQATKPVPAVPQKAPVKALSKKPSSLLPKHAAATAVTSTKATVVPAMVALPPSPTPEDVAEPEAGDDKADAMAPVSGEEAKDEAEQALAGSSSVPDVEVSGADEDTEQTIQNVTQTSVVPVDTGLPTPPSSREPHSVDTVKKVLDNQELRLPTSNGNLPRTPHNNLIPNPLVNAAGIPTKTPISALLSSIERGFEYSPTTPLSPADNYIPGPNGVITYTHVSHRSAEGPMQPFNHALHGGFKGSLFGTHFGSKAPQEELKRGDIGVVALSEHNKLYNGPMGLPSLDDGARHAFIEINK